MAKSKTRDAMKIIDRMIGDDDAMRKRIAEARTSSKIAQLVYDARITAGLTQQELADLAETGQSTIARLENADYEGHSLSMPRRVAKALGCQIKLSLIPDNDRSRVA